MSQYPPPGPNPPPYYGPPPHWPPQPHHYPPSDPNQHPHQPHPYPYYVPGAMMIPVPMMPHPPTDSSAAPQPTYITNYIYHGESSNQPAPPAIEGSAVHVVENSGEFSWVPTTSHTAFHLNGQAVEGGREGWDGSSLWVIRAWHNGDLIPGKFSVRHNSASVMYGGKEVPVQNIEVLCAKPENLRWVPASNGNIPPGAIPGGRTSNGETLYVGRARYQLSITPGKVQPSHKCCYIGFAGNEVSLKAYDVLSRI